MKLLKFISIVFFGLLLNVSIAQDLDEVLEAHFEAVNQDAVSQLKGMHIKGKSGRGGQEFDFEMWQKRPGMFRMQVDIQGMQMIQVYDGEKAYIVAPWAGTLEPQEMGVSETEQVKEQADIDGDLWNWKEKESTLSLEESEDFEGTEVFVLKLVKKNGDVITYYLDADSYLPIKTESIMQTQGAEVKVEAFMSNYKEVDGIITPFYIENRMNGNIESTVTMKEVIFNPEMADDLFNKPPSPPAPETPVVPETPKSPEGPK